MHFTFRGRQVFLLQQLWDLLSMGDNASFHRISGTSDGNPAAIDVENHEFIIPVKEIKVPADIQKWEKSEVGRNVQWLIMINDQFLVPTRPGESSHSVQVAELISESALRNDNLEGRFAQNVMILGIHKYLSFAPSPQSTTSSVSGVQRLPWVPASNEHLD